MTNPEPVWTPIPERAVAAGVADFRAYCARHSGAGFADWPAFHAWSVQEFRLFWTLFVEWSGLRFDGLSEPVCEGNDVETARFFPAMRLSYTEQLLDGLDADDDAGAVLEYQASGDCTTLNRRTLRQRVAQAARALASIGVEPGDRVVALVTHDADTLVTALAAIGLGATWSACGPELADAAVEARFTLLDARWLVVSPASTSRGGTEITTRARILADALPTLRGVILTRDDAPAAVPSGHAEDWSLPVHRLPNLAATFSSAPFAWPRLPFDHPLFVLFSSGTTGPPKPIVHGLGGTLIEHLKEHRLHGDLRHDDRLYFHTSCGWMMWHWTVSALATGASIVTYHGAMGVPSAPTLWDLGRHTSATALGLSPALLHLHQELHAAPRAEDLPTLRAVYSTGSALRDADFDWLASHLPDVQVQSISGGTDIIGCFVLGHPALPVWRGESQCLSLGLDVRALSAESGPAELVCGTPFPSRPLGFLHDPEGRRFHAAYFAEHPPLWTHGDFVVLSSRGSARILGRSDAVLKVNGVRIGPAEITALVEAMPEVAEAMAVEDRGDPAAPDGRIVLLVVLARDATLDRTLTHRIKRRIRDRQSADHVPAIIVAVDALPMTHNGKRSERAARDAIHGRSIGNRAALQNPQVVDALRALPEFRDR